MVQFLISAGSGEQRQDGAIGSTALIWVTGLWGTVITPLSSSGLKWCSWAWRTLANEPACSQMLGNTFLITEVSYIHVHSVWFKSTTLLTTQVNQGFFLFCNTKSCLYSCSLEMNLLWNSKHAKIFMDNMWGDRKRPRRPSASPLICPVPLLGLNKTADPQAPQTATDNRMYATEYQKL